MTSSWRTRGGAVVVGSLEAAVLDHLWLEGGEADAKAVHRAIGTKRRITLNTIQSTLERLYRKDLLGRRKLSHAFVYSPRVSREQFATRLVEGVVDSVLGGDGSPLLVAFLDLTERMDPATLSRLERAIAARRATTAVTGKD